MAIVYFAYSLSLVRTQISDVLERVDSSNAIFPEIFDQAEGYQTKIPEILSGTETLRLQIPKILSPFDRLQVLAKPINGIMWIRTPKRRIEQLKSK